MRKDLVMKKKILLPFVATSILLSGCGTTSPNSESVSSVNSEQESTEESQNENYVYKKEMVLSQSYGEKSGIYTGEINKSGLPDGFGSFTAKNKEGISWTYYGKWENGHFSGTGTTEFEDGSSFIGTYRNDWECGPGIYNDGQGYWECAEFEDGTEIECYYYQDSSDDSVSEINIDQSLSIDTWDIQIHNVQIKDSVSDSSVYSEPSDGCKYISINLSVTNTGKNPFIFLPQEAYQGDIRARVVCGDGLEFVPTHLEDYSYDILGRMINPSMVDSGEIIFDIPDSVIESSEEIVLKFIVGSDCKEIKIQ